MAIHAYKRQGDSTITPLSDEELSSINGGFIYLSRYSFKYEVIDDETGDVLDAFEYDDLESARQFAREIGVSEALVTTSVVDDLRRAREEI